MVPRCEILLNRSVSTVPSFRGNKRKTCDDELDSMSEAPVCFSFL